MPQIRQHLPSLVAADHVPGLLFRTTGSAYPSSGAFELFIFRIAGLEVAAGIVCGPLALGSGNLLYVHAFTFLSGIKIENSLDLLLIMPYTFLISNLREYFVCRKTTTQ